VHDEVKAYLSYADQVVLLEQRGMDVGDHDDAARVLRRINYYRLSGYCYSFRQRTDEGRGDTFYQGTRLADVVALYEFDARLRTATFSTLAPIELALRALLGHELGRIDPCVHLDSGMLGPTARQGTSYDRWRKTTSTSWRAHGRTSSYTTTASTVADCRCGPRSSCLAGGA
jgi:abortive infection bacteriophage resistance protein